ncbi:hypothetical protein SKAU_G00074900 [Synaphobranchus kaupii]|uniref:Uncharacterized protein n=1 Tax=Synaphobranchus kaupii TaxID=118154 RepID=A0A9Q1G932_SYNKA|nr:hypothetical protein SKAU_G00074900 [Synaphobranchus kaupii]
MSEPKHTQAVSVAGRRQIAPALTPSPPRKVSRRPWKCQFCAHSSSSSSSIDAHDPQLPASIKSAVRAVHCGKTEGWLELWLLALVSSDRCGCLRVLAEHVWGSSIQSLINGSPVQALGHLAGVEMVAGSHSSSTEWKCLSPSIRRRCPWRAAVR